MRSVKIICIMVIFQVLTLSFAADGLFQSRKISLLAHQVELWKQDYAYVTSESGLKKAISNGQSAYFPPSTNIALSSTIIIPPNVSLIIEGGIFDCSNVDPCIEIKP